MFYAIVAIIVVALAYIAYAVFDTKRHIREYGGATGANVTLVLKIAATVIFAGCAITLVQFSEYIFVVIGLVVGLLAIIGLEAWGLHRREDGAHNGGQ
ncbi:MAG: hypothetical protein UHD09_05485 [Bifidobacterium sp.]|nr:hypothetical protein [Bifidobacterium sp.]